MVDWYFSEETDPSNELVDHFADSKFEIDKWTSFAREIVQNSLDAQDDYTKPVIVVFDLNKTLSIHDIPGCEKTIEVLKKCYLEAKNSRTKGAYSKGIEILSKPEIYCLKISDYNTKGVETGRDCAWGALVYDEGVSVKQRPGSAGSHGVGKKVPFIISTCNTVFYSTKNKTNQNGIVKSDSLFEGKTMLINWKDDQNKRRSPKGWYGKIQDGVSDYTNIVSPLENDELESIPPYFKRTDDYGTDVIIVGVNAYEQEDAIKRNIINAILCHFFVALKRGNLEVNAFGEVISRQTFQSVFNRWYQEPEQTKNSLKDCLEAFSNLPEEIPILDKLGNELGEALVYFKLGNSLNKKYYSIVRSHGMRINDICVRSADQPFTAVVITEGKELNVLLSKLENAAHDNFITEDEDVEIDPKAVDAYNQLRDRVKDLIIKYTKFDDGETQTIEGLESIITIPGTYANVKEKGGALPRIKRNPIRKKSDQGTKSKDYEEGFGTEGEGTDKKKKRKTELGHKPNKKGGESKAILYENYAVSPFVINNPDGFDVFFETNESIQNATIRISSINSDDKTDDSLYDIISKVIYKRKSYKYENGVIKGVFVEANNQAHIRISLKRKIVYQIKVDLFYLEEQVNE